MDFNKDSLKEAMDIIFEGLFKKKVIRGGKLKKKKGTNTAGKRIDSTGKRTSNWSAGDSRKKGLEQSKSKRKHPVKKSAKIKRKKSMKKRSRLGL